jgi:hypothetical protein
MGKSSVMNLLRCDLVRYGFRPVWFNAWHHQKEEHLLASLLQSIKLQALPGWLAPEGLWFRANLLWIRGWRRWVPAFLLLLVFAASVTFEYRHQQTGNFLAAISEWKGDFTPLLERIKSSNATIAMLVSALGILLTAVRGLVAFGKSPATLMAGMAGGLKIRDLDAQTSFRQKFSLEFNDVTTALGSKRPMTIFIDDLDRCRPDQILDVLEAVNFLVSSGDCYVVFGMARDRVERCVGLSFKDIAEEMADETASPSNPDDRRKARTDFARQYLDKLINVEVPLALPTSQQSGAIMKNTASIGRPDSGYAESASVWLGRSLPMVVALLALVLGVIVGRWIPADFGRADKDNAAAVSSTLTPNTASNASPPTNAGTAAPAVKNPRVPSSANQAAQITNASPPTRIVSASAPFLLMVLLLAAGTVQMMLRPPNVVVKDSKEFEDALAIWHEVLFSKQRTPRWIKRFMNRIRYVAMRERPLSEGLPRWQMLRRNVGLGLRSQKTAASDQKASLLPESLLVAFAAILSVDPHWFEQADAFDPPAKDADENERGISLLTRCKRMHQKAFGNWNLARERYSRYQQHVSGIRVN